MSCRYPDCTEDAIPDGSRCERHLFRWASGKPVERIEPDRRPEWRRRLVAKDMSGWDRAA